MTTELMGIEQDVMSWMAQLPEFSAGEPQLWTHNKAFASVTNLGRKKNRHLITLFCGPQIGDGAADLACGIVDGSENIVAVGRFNRRGCLELDAPKGKLIRLHFVTDIATDRDIQVLSALGDHDAILMLQDALVSRGTSEDLKSKIRAVVLSLEGAEESDLGLTREVMDAPVGAINQEIELPTFASPDRDPNPKPRRRVDRWIVCSPIALGGLSKASSAAREATTAVGQGIVSMRDGWIKIQGTSQEIPFGVVRIHVRKASAKTPGKFEEVSKLCYAPPSKKGRFSESYFRDIFGFGMTNVHQWRWEVVDVENLDENGGTTESDVLRHWLEDLSGTSVVTKASEKRTDLCKLLGIDRERPQRG